MSTSFEQQQASLGVFSQPTFGSRSRQPSGKGQSYGARRYGCGHRADRLPRGPLSFRSTLSARHGAALHAARYRSLVAATAQASVAPAHETIWMAIAEAAPATRFSASDLPPGQRGRTRLGSGSTGISSAGGVRRSSGPMISSCGTSRGTSASRSVRKSTTGRGQREVKPDAEIAEDDLNPALEGPAQQHQNQLPRPHGLECRMLRTRSGVPRVVRPATAYWSHTPRVDDDPATFRAVLDALERGAFLLNISILCILVDKVDTVSVNYGSRNVL